MRMLRYKLEIAAFKRHLGSFFRPRVGAGKMETDHVGE